GVSTEYAHTGTYSMKMTVDTDYGQNTGCRQFRHEESRSSGEYYYSVWILFPEYYTINDWSNIIQFKSKLYDRSRNDAVWVLELRNRDNGTMYFMLRWKGKMAGPAEGEGAGLKHYHQELMDVPVGQWFHLEVYLKQSEAYNGQIAVWQDGVEIYNMNKVKTKYPDSWQEWSVNTYTDHTDGVTPRFFTMYVDDAVVSTSRLGIKPQPPDTIPSAPKNLSIKK
ncbi:MAG: hypothetical protein GY757_14965, partial [bacterium]|nr:hypothetical protein [bacterium]